MEQKPQNSYFPSQLRFDVVSKDWVVIATGRGKRPEAFKKERVKSPITEKECVFCNLEENLKGVPPKLLMVQGKVPCGCGFDPNWSVAVIPNKYPAFVSGDRLDKENEGKFYQKMNAVGYCEVVITRDHNKSLALLEEDQVKEVLDVYQLRYLDLKKRKFVNYISIFHNHGLEAGASQPHPHSQIITSPLIDVGLTVSLERAQRYYKKHRRCIYCEMNKWDLKQKKRIVFENEHFIALCPFAAKAAFEVIISPKKHISDFEAIEEKEKKSLAQALRLVLHKLYSGLDDPAYNFYLHCAPCDGKNHVYYHWHWTIIPKTAVPAGFEMGTKMEISNIEPEAAAEYLRNQN